MAARRKPGGKKNKHTGGSAVPWVLYPLAVMVGTTAGVLYYFNNQPPTPPPPASRSKARIASTPAQTTTPQRVRPKPRPQEEPDEPAVTVRTVPARPKPAATSPAEPTSTTATATVTPPPAPGAVSPLPPTEIERGAGHRPEVALTFDAGSDWRPVKKILETLEAHQAKATFFLTGEWVEKNPKTTQLIAAAGHEFGNHSWNHPAFTHLPDSEIRDQVRRTDAKITEVTGKSSHPYFRPPLGDRDARVRRLIGDEGFLTIYWSLDSRDSVDKGITADTIRERVLGKSKAGSIVLLHCGSQASADALSGILDGFETKGLTQVPLSRLLQE
jgi:peptidoglycan/xylan/chitin deacetylase (PgdA/CDA1 family)